MNQVSGANQERVIFCAYVVRKDGKVIRPKNGKLLAFWVDD